LRRAENVNGEIWLENLHAAASASTTNGPITARGLRGPALLETVNGSIDVEYAGAGRGRINASSVNGRVTARLASAASVRLAANSLWGTIHDGLGLRVNRRGPGGESVQATLAGGEGELVLSSVNGDVVLERAR
jgi:DUF4097 and DUF4098 domain-containing protein YvlB